MKNEEIALLSYAQSILNGSSTCQQDAWIAWRKSLGLEVPEDHYECYNAYSEDEEWDICWAVLYESPKGRAYLAPYLAIQETIAHLKSSLPDQLTQGDN